jgi:hypothetical protein
MFTHMSTKHGVDTRLKTEKDIQRNFGMSANRTKNEITVFEC